MENTDTSSKNECPYCGGLGFVHPMRDGHVIYSKVINCSCVKDLIGQQRKQRLIDGCKFPPFAESMSLKNFKVYQAVRTAYKIAMQISNKPGELCWLAFLGTNGIGKTHLAIGICKAWIDAGIPARYTFVSLLLDELREGFRKENGEHTYEAKFSYYCNIPLLLLDDYGVESSTPWVQEKLDTIVDYRLMNNLSLIVTSNKSLDEMPSRIQSRLVRHPKSQIVAITGDDYTLVKNR